MYICVSCDKKICSTLRQHLSSWQEIDSKSHLIQGFLQLGSRAAAPPLMSGKSDLTQCCSNKNINIDCFKHSLAKTPRLLGWVLYSSRHPETSKPQPKPSGDMRQAGWWIVDTNPPIVTCPGSQHWVTNYVARLAARLGIGGVPL